MISFAGFFLEVSFDKEFSFYLDTHATFVLSVRR